MKVGSKELGNRILATFFVIFISSTFIMNAKTICGLAKTEFLALFGGSDEAVLIPQEIENEYNESFYKRYNYVELNGLSARIINQRIINGTIRDKNNQLNLMDNLEYHFDEKTERTKVDRAVKILDAAQDKGAQVLYVQRPWKNADGGENTLPYGLQLDYDEQFDYWCESIANVGYPVLDFRESLKDDLSFYDTDHHWTIESSLAGAKNIAARLSREYNLELDEENLLDRRNFNEKIYKDSFLGSEGIRAGEYYAGKDDFDVIWPKYDTNIEYWQYHNHEQTDYRAGDFKQAFVSMNLINDESYNNKYFSYLFNGDCENIIINHNANNKTKVLLISDSYSRPMSTFLSMCFYETRYLDPQEGRYTDSLVEYINEYNPDFVIFMFAGDGTIQNI